MAHKRKQQPQLQPRPALVHRARLLALVLLVQLLLATPVVDAANEKATSVWNLKPSQVDVVLALGDSITAGFGMEGRIGGYVYSKHAAPVLR